MNLFSTIMQKIFHHGAAAVPAAPVTSAAAPRPAAQPVPAPAAAVPAQPVDVEAVLEKMAAAKPGGGGNWRVSVADLLRLLDMDPSLTARKQLAEELGVHAGEAGTAEQNIALQKAVMRKLAENGGKVPASLRD